ncbi:probable RNA methyltransferase At5g51130 [Euphorbia lathyris]|uniref:probable RNA methyltransferase At5g51130 n=1 Tax=Euphorbia lathyris TaxID=212925 RepID=UPI0033133552
MKEENGFKNKNKENTDKKWKKKKNKQQQEQKQKQKQKQQQQEEEKEEKEQQEQNLLDKEKENESEEKKNLLKEDEKEKSHSKQDTEQVNNDNKKKRKRKEVFPFGNYRSYYGYRIGQDMEEDPRLRVLDRNWFEGKNCLDIGCNSGILTIQIAKKFHCRKILGIDIDSDRIKDAYWHLRKSMREIGKISTKASELNVTKDMKGSHPDAIDLFDIVSFRKENFVQSQLREEEQYDTILCMSVTKWIHLNWGDEGLITTFSKIWRLLRPGGILVLEPQPWKSYESNRLVSETITMNYRNIIFRPEHFEEILLDKIGFRKVEDVTSALSDTKAGFNRPIFAYHK